MSHRNSATALSPTSLIQASQLVSARAISLLVLVLLITNGGAG
jgi:hypothetical protein